MQADREYETVSNMLCATQDQLQSTLQTQQKRFRQLMERMVRLHEEIGQLEGRTASHTSTR
jgi:hypothetical protein